MKTITVKLTLPQLWLIVEQMDKGAAAWDISKLNHIAVRISRKLRLAAAVAAIHADIAKKPKSRKEGR